MAVIDQFIEILKKKGTGKTMSKHMDSDDISFIFSHLLSSDIPMAMKSTLLTAWIMLDANEEEAAGLKKIQSHLDVMLPPELLFLFDNPTTFFDHQLHHVFQHQDIDYKSLNECLSMIDSGHISDYKTASLFEGLRLKEESAEENQCVLDFYAKHSTFIELDLPCIIDMASAYDGFNRHYFLQPFVAALLSSIGIRSILHGVHETSPKNGMNTHKLFLESNKNPLKSLSDVANDILNPGIGWGYVDQSVFCPSLYHLMPIRRAMVKRPVLSTIEKWLSPIRGHRTVCLTGFTHSGYKKKTIDIVQKANAFNDLILVRGVEGSTLLPYDRRCPLITSQGAYEPSFDFISPGDVGHTPLLLDDQSPDNSLSAGCDALEGKNINLKNYLIYQCLAIGKVIGHDIQKMAMALDKAIESGKALDHWYRL